MNSVKQYSGKDWSTKENIWGRTLSGSNFYRLFTNTPTEGWNYFKELKGLEKKQSEKKVSKETQRLYDRGHEREPIIAERVGAIQNDWILVDEELKVSGTIDAVDMNTKTIYEIKSTVHTKIEYLNTLWKSQFQLQLYKFLLERLNYEKYHNWNYCIVAEEPDTQILRYFKLEDLPNLIDVKQSIRDFWNQKKPKLVKPNLLEQVYKKTQIINDLKEDLKDAISKKQALLEKIPTGYCIDGAYSAIKYDYTSKRKAIKESVSHYRKFKIYKNG